MKVSIKELGALGLSLLLTTACGSDKKDSDKSKEKTKTEEAKTENGSKAEDSAELTALKTEISDLKNKMEEANKKSSSTEEELETLKKALEKTEIERDLELSKIKFLPVLRAIENLEVDSEKRMAAINAIESSRDAYLKAQINAVKLQEEIRAFSDDAPGRAKAIEKLEILRTYKTKLDWLYDKYLLPITLSENISSDENQELHAQYKLHSERLNRAMEKELAALEA